ncbi:MAG: hypothetical protein WBW83_10260 [Terriglobales bacterium]
MPKMTAAEAGRRGGRSRSEKKLEAARKNGFQPGKVETENERKQTAVLAPRAEAK